MSRDKCPPHAVPVARGGGKKSYVVKITHVRSAGDGADLGEDVGRGRYTGTTFVLPTAVSDTEYDCSHFTDEASKAPCAWPNFLQLRRCFLLDPGSEGSSDP